MNEPGPLPLFRREALEAQRTSWLGGIALSQPPQWWVFTVLAFVVGLTLVTLLTTASYVRRTRVIGHLVPTQGLIALSAPAAGNAMRVLVAEGERVAAGQVLIVLRSTRSTLINDDTVGALAATVAARRRSLDKALAANDRQHAAQTRGLQSQLADAQQEHARLLAELALRGRQLRLTQEITARWQSLFEQRYVSELQWQQQQSAWLAQQAEAESLRRQALAARRLAAQLRQSLAELPACRAASESGLQRERAGVERDGLELLANNEHAVRAPVAGQVAALLIKSGQSAQAGQFLASLLPGDGRLEAELLAPSRAIGFVAPGDQVRLRYQAFPFQKFGHQPGQVSVVGRSALGAEELKGFAQRLVQTEPLYRIAVRLERQAVHANGRQRAAAARHAAGGFDILRARRRRLYEWLFEPLYAIRANLLAQSATPSR